MITFLNTAAEFVDSIIDEAYGFTGWRREAMNILLWLTLVPFIGLLFLFAPIIFFIKQHQGKK